ncbi:uncharacterized protein LOC116847890 [Odontomachus brunneus]|uniref:uncharacterized protein LOC116847890 n=1 Tax=Odontomachus brunneus TaxID=486640 RepID=UPI0013F243F0|nr:uncharacterized protein LOC116847890 [Odontomachus brunneus]
MSFHLRDLVRFNCTLCFPRDFHPCRASDAPTVARKCTIETSGTAITSKAPEVSFLFRKTFEQSYSRQDFSRLHVLLLLGGPIDCLYSPLIWSGIKHISIPSFAQQLRV